MSSFPITSPLKFMQSQHFKPDQQSQPSQKPQGTKWVIVVLPALLAISLLFLSHHIGWISKERTPLEESAGRVLDRVFRNLKKKPITAIVSKGADDCPESYEVLHAGYWHGVKRGCLCDNGQVVEWHKCLTHSRCRYVSKLDAEGLQYWGTSANKYGFCVKRVEENIHKRRCSSQQVQCASDVCVPTTDLCPLNTVQCQASQTAFTAPERTANINFYNVAANEVCLNSFDESNKLTKRPIVHFEISNTDGQVCLDPQLSQVTQQPAGLVLQTNVPFPSTENYPLQNQQNVGCNRFGKIDTTGTPALLSNLDVGANPAVSGYVGVLSANNLYSDLSNHYKYLQFVPYDYKVFLNAEHKFEIAEGSVCDSFDHEDFDRVSSRVEWTVLVLKWFNRVIFVLSIISLLLGLFLVALFFSSSQDESVQVKRQKIAKLYVLTSFVIAVLALLSALSYYFFLRGLLQNSLNKTDSYRQNSCLPQPTGINDAIQVSNDYARAYIEDVKKSVVGSLTVALVYLAAWGALWKLWSNRAQQAEQ